MEMVRRYQSPERLIEVLRIIPHDLAWNYLHAILEPEISSSTDLDGTLKITKGMPSPQISKLINVCDHPAAAMNFLVGTNGKRTTWKTLEVEENETYWIEQARTNYLNCCPLNVTAEIYRLKELELLYNAHHSGDEEKLISDFGIHAYYDRFSEPYRSVLKITENVRRKETDGLIERFDRELKQI